MTLRFTTENPQLPSELIGEQAGKPAGAADLESLKKVMCTLLHGEGERDCGVSILLANEVDKGYIGFSHFFIRLMNTLIEKHGIKPARGIVAVANDMYTRSLTKYLIKTKNTRVTVETVSSLEGSLVNLEAVLERLELDKTRQALIVQTYNRDFGIEYSDFELERFLYRAKNLEDVVAGIIIDAKYSFLHYRKSIGIATAKNMRIPVWITSQTNTSMASLPGVLLLSLNESALNMTETVINDSGLSLLKRDRDSSEFVRAVFNSLYLIQKEGLEQWVARHQRKADIAYNRLPRYGFTPLYDNEEHRSIFITAFTTPGNINAMKLYDDLKEKGFIIDKPVKEDKILLSTMGATTPGEFNALIESIILHAL